MLVLPEVGDQVPRRNSPFLKWLGTTTLQKAGWTCTGSIPNIPKAVIIAAPHTSNWDGIYSLSLVQALQLRINTMGKASLFKYPVIAKIMLWVGLFPIDRTAPNGVVGQSIERFNAAEKLWLMMAPEGTRGGATTWKSGFYNIAVGAKVPIFAAALDYAKKKIVLMELFHPTGDFKTDLPRIIDMFVHIEPGRLDKLSGPLLEAREKLGKKTAKS